MLSPGCQEAQVQRLSRFFRFPGYRAKHVIKGEAQSLHEFGLDGQILCAPGHNPGSISIIMDNGAAFVGDLCPPLRR
jgi:glyoxylase-like metal-dependent hydrolase (beta-lactamase superfamily II)